jgi:protein-tyrosine phosphatase
MWTGEQNSVGTPEEPVDARLFNPPTIDIHCHCLPGLDDGPATTDIALALCRQMVADGTSAAIATPHQLGSYERRNSPAEIRSLTIQMNQTLSEAGIHLKLSPGAEVRLDGQLLELLQKDAVLTLADRHRHLLLELPGEPLIDIEPVLKLLNSRQIVVILAHPERHRPLRRRFDLLKKWADLGCAFQLNAASLAGVSSPEESDLAWKMIDAGLVDFVASDCHSPNRRPSLIAKAQKLLLDRVGYSVTRRLCCDNPAAVLAGTSVRTWQSSTFSASPARLPASGASA